MVQSLDVDALLAEDLARVVLGLVGGVGVYGRGIVSGQARVAVSQRALTLEVGLVAANDVALVLGSLGVAEGAALLHVVENLARMLLGLLRGLWVCTTSSTVVSNPANDEHVLAMLALWPPATLLGLAEVLSYEEDMLLDAICV